jgi:prepilin-type N-terminal cleavage/methylation domain-containing protein/prepilin-type processing-associated H-X9-DG protein
VKPCFSKKRNRALTLPEVLVVIAILVILAIVLLPVLAATHHRSDRIGCVSNLRQIGDACGVWAGNHNNQYPMSFSETTNVAAYFQVMSNELVTPKVLICPSDREHAPATNFQSDFNNSHISYFIGPDASESYPQQIMSGDANLAIDGVPVKSGLVVFPSNAQVSWTAARHGRNGTIVYADGSVAEVSPTGLQSALALSTNGTPITTNCLAIP